MAASGEMRCEQLDLVLYATDHVGPKCGCLVLAQQAELHFSVPSALAWVQVFLSRRSSMNS